MEYYKINNDKIEKYLVNINKEEIEKIKNELLENFTIVTHHKDRIYIYGSSDAVEMHIYRLKQNNKVKNIKYTFPDDEHFCEINYDISYTLYSIKELIKLLDNLLINENTNVLESIKSINITEFDFDKLCKELNNDISSLTKLKSNIKNNKEKYNLNKYKESIFNNINLTLIDTINLEEVKRLKSFFADRGPVKMPIEHADIIERLLLTEEIK